MAKRQVVTGEKVRVHFNLHTHLWSVTARQGVDKGRVIANLERVAIRDCRMIVSETARQRVVANKCREVHAWVEGTVCEMVELEDAMSFTYNPYRAATFTQRLDEKPVLEAGTCWFMEKGQAWYGK